MAESDLKVNRCQWWWRTQQVAPLLVEMFQPGQNILRMVWEKLTGLGGRCTRAARRGYSARRVLIVDEVTNEAVRTPTSEPFSVSQLSVSYALSGGEHYYYNSCTKEEKSQKCNRFLLSGSIGASVGVGRFISYSIHGALSYEWTDCGGESSRSSLDISIEQCYFGQCWSIDLPPFYKKEW